MIYPLGPSGFFHSFLIVLSFASSNRFFHSISGIIGGRSYLGFVWKWTLYWSLTYFKYVSTNEVTPILLKETPNRLTKWSISSFFKLGFWAFHCVHMVALKISCWQSVIKHIILLIRKNWLQSEVRTHNPLVNITWRSS